MVVKFTIDVKQASKMFTKFANKMDQVGEKGLKEWGNHAVNKVLQQATTVGLKQFRKGGSMFTSTRWMQNGKTGYMMMPMSGIHQDSSQDHWVTINKSKPMLQAWARQKGFKGGSFYFRHRPFISVGLRNARNRLKPTLRTYVRQALREAKT